VAVRIALGSKDRRLLQDSDAIVGVDEVGRGALAGPVVVCAARFESIPVDDGIQDSKLLNAIQRQQSLERLLDRGVRWTVCEISPGEIDRINILEATRLAMRAAALTVVGPSSFVVTDHVDPGDLGCRVISPARADLEYFCVAAASIIAKVHRDRIMVELGRRDSRWGWEKNMGYGTAQHRGALGLWPPTAHHRRSFCWTPVGS
jgi:ribonuclease HII